MKGETITVLTRTKTGENAFGESTYEWSAAKVDNCLVRPLSASDIDTSERPDGIELQYSIAFPKVYTGPALAHARVVLSDRTGEVEDAGEAAETALRVSGSPDFTQPCPTAWNMLVTVGVFNG